MGSVGCWGGGRARQLLLSSVPEHPQTLRPGQQAGVPRPPPPVSSSRSPAGARAVWPGWWDQRGRPADSGSTAQVPTCEVTGCDAAYFYP